MPSRDIIGSIIDRYRIDKKLGQGGMASVYAATDTRLTRQVAIKIMHPHLAEQTSFQERFLNEARTAANLDHPNIIRIFSFDHIDGDLFLVMDYLQGGNLRQHVKALHENARIMGFPQIVELVRQLASALHYAQERGMVHRDIKPDNVLLKPQAIQGAILDFVPVITDFGLAKLTISGEDAVTDQQPIGTYPYMSPEQCLAEPVDGRTDIYSLGVLFYELAVGRLPFQPRTIAEATRAHGETPVPLPSEIRPDFPSNIEAIILKCLAKAPTDRYQTGYELVAALEAIQKPSDRAKRPSIEMPAIAVVEEAAAPLPPAPVQAVIPEPPADPNKTQAIPIISDATVPEMKAPSVTGEAAFFDQLLIHRDGVTQAIPIRLVISTIGRDADQDIRLDDPSVSRHHARLESDGYGGYRLVDLESTNGTWLNGTRLTSHTSTTIQAGQALRLGRFWLMIVQPSEEDAFAVPVQSASTTSNASYPVLSLEVEDEEEVLPESLSGMSFSAPVAAPIPLHVEDKFDVYKTQLMRKELAESVPYYSEPPLTEEQRKQDRLMIYNEKEGVRVAILNSDRITIGRADGQFVRLDNNTVSRRHAIITRDVNQTYFITDVGSTNGTFIGPDVIPYDTAYELTGDKVIRIGEYWLTLLRSDSKSAMVRIDKMRTWLDEDQLSADKIKQATSQVQAVNPTLNAEELVGKTLGTFRLSQFIGYSNVASVYIGADIKQNQRVALKLMQPYLTADELFVRAFYEEAQIATRLRHPNIVRCSQYTEADGHLFIVMEVVDGPSLANYLDGLKTENRRIDIVNAVTLMRQVADGLHYAHQQGMYYRAMNPRNIVLRTQRREDGGISYTPVLTDLALAKLVEQSDFYIPDQATSMYKYVSPERCLGLRTDLRSDIYELGIMMYEILTGQTPFSPRSLSDATRLHTRTPIVPPRNLRPDLPANLERVITKCLAKDPNDRYQTSSEISRDLQEVYLAMTRIATEDEYVTDADLLETAYMPSPLSPQMPYYTPQQLTKEERGIDRLAILSELYPPFFVPITQNIITIGRGPGQMLNLDSKTVSREHARLERGIDGSYRLIDLGSTNGTYVGEQQITANETTFWQAEKIARIGEYWLRIERAGDVARRRLLGKGLTELDDADQDENGPLLDVRDYVGFRERASQSGPVRPIRQVELPPPDHDKVGLEVSNPYVTVTPGSTMAIAIEVINQSDLVDHFSIHLDGLPPDWYTAPAEPLYLLPNNRGTASITLHPPLASSSTAGAHAFEVYATTRSQGIESVAQQCAVTVTPFYNFTADMQPQRVTGRGRTEIRIENTGNTFDTYTFQARDREQMIRFVMPGKQFMLKPGQVEYVPIQAIAKERPFTGLSKSLPFEIQISSQQEGTFPQTETGELVVGAVMPGWMIGCTAVLVLLLCAAILIGAFFASQSYFAQQTGTVVAFATDTSATQTASVFEDSDSDRLSNLREIELGTDPNMPDTDGDGLTDGDEILVWNTIPTNRDTDGDTLSDGDEVTIYGTNPLNPDTDGDGIPDTEDPFPLMRATPTVTPFPLATGLCPGSPPTRLAMGMVGLVEEGGVNNRLRAEPSKEGEIISSLAPGTLFTITNGPVCDETDFILWWEVNANGLKGWTAEGEGEEYYLAPPDAPSTSDTSGASARQQAETDTVLASLGAPSSALLQRVNMGVQLQPDYWNTNLALADQMGMGWIKIQVNWNAVQPAGPQTMNDTFRSLIGLVEEADRRGFQILVSVAKAPAWARSNTASAGPPDDPQALADFLTFMLTQMGGRVDAVEVWNEPNLIDEWTGTLAFNGEGYMQLFAPAYRAIRNFSPQIVIVTAGLAPATDSAVSVQDRTYLNQMYNAGLADFDDIVLGVHPYGWGNAPDVRCCDPVEGRGWDEAPQFFYLQTLEDYHAIASANRHNIPLWVTEFGWATWEDLGGSPPEPWMSYITLANQESYTLRAFQIGQALDYVGAMFLWNLDFATASSVASGDSMSGFSLIINGRGARPLFNTLSTP